MLTREEILAAKDLREEIVDVPEWGGTVRIVTMTGAERDSFDALLAEKRVGDSVDIRGIRPYLVLLTAHGENGERLFTEKDLPALEAKSGIVIERLAKAARKVNALTDAELEERKADFPAGQNAGSGSPSPLPSATSPSGNVKPQ